MSLPYQAAPEACFHGSLPLPTFESVASQHPGESGAQESSDASIQELLQASIIRQASSHRGRPWSPPIAHHLNFYSDSLGAPSPLASLARESGEIDNAPYT